MEDKSHGGKRRGAGRKPVLDKNKQVVFYIPNKSILKFGSVDKLKEAVVRFIENGGEVVVPEKPVSNVQYKAPDETAYDGAKLPANYSLDEPLSFDKLRQTNFNLAPTPDYMGQMDRAQDLEELEAIGRKIKASGMSWKEQQRYHEYGRQIAKNKFI